MKQIALVVFVALLLIGAIPVAAQDGPSPTIPPPVSDPTPDAELILREARIAALDAERAASSADRILAFIESAGSLLTLATVLIAVGGVIATGLGLRSVGRLGELSARSDDLLNRIEAVEKTVSAELSSLDEKRQALERLEQDISSVTQRLDDRISDVLQQIAEKIERKLQALAMGQLGAQQIVRNNLEEALDNFTDAVQLDPDNRVLRYFLGDLCVRRERLEEGIEHLKAAGAGQGVLIGADVSYAYALRLQGDQYPEGSGEREQLYHQSGLLFEQAYARKPDLLDITGESAYGALAGLYLRQGRYDMALKYYEAAREVTPQNSYPLNNLGLVHYWHGDRGRALAHFRDVLQIALDKLAIKRSDLYAWFDRITAEVALGEVPEETLIEHANMMLGLRPGPTDMAKFISGLNRLRRPASGAINADLEPPAHLEALIAHVEAQDGGGN
jgi:tetratricopeptide (TPR) repeat protein